MLCTEAETALTCAGEAVRCARDRLATVHIGVLVRGAGGELAGASAGDGDRWAALPTTAEGDGDRSCAYRTITDCGVAGIGV